MRAHLIVSLILASFRSLLDLPTPEEFADFPSKIFVSKDRKKKQFLVLMSFPLVKEIDSRRSELEKKVAGNPFDNVECLLSAPFNTDTFVAYTRLVMRLYKRL